MFPDELDYFEEQSRSQVADDVDGNSKKPDREVKSEDGADVVVEDEEIVELDSTGNPISECHTFLLIAKCLIDNLLLSVHNNSSGNKCTHLF